MRLNVRKQTWPIDGSFAISRGSRSEVNTVIVELIDGDYCGQAECVPYAHYGETVQSVLAQIEQIRSSLENGSNQADIQKLMSAGAARNAVDCALWDLHAKSSGTSAWETVGLPCPQSTTTAYTLSLDAPSEMEKNARIQATRPLLKIKVGSEDDIARVEAVRKGAPDAALIVDANEAWNDLNIVSNLAAMAQLGVSMVEQPIPADADDILYSLDRPLPVCADEACHTTAGLQNLVGKYDVINIKLDKTGGLTEALRLLSAAQSEGLDIMVGCMLGSSLAMAPAYALAGSAKFVDLDGPLLLAEDFDPPIDFDGSIMMRPVTALWG